MRQQLVSGYRRGYSVDTNIMTSVTARLVERFTPPNERGDAEGVQMPPPPPLPTPESIWQTYDQMETCLSTPLSERMLDLAGLEPGMRVLDLATGRGEPAIRAAHRVGPDGFVLGIDVSASMLAMARERAGREGVRNLELRAMDAASLESIPGGHFDVTLARWGLMYFDSPVRALDGARRVMGEKGRLVVAVLAEPERCSYFSLPRQVFERYRTLPPIDPAAPGPFRYADIERLRADLARAQWRVEHVEEMVVPVMEAETGGAVVEWVRAFGMGRLLADLSDDTRRSWEAAFVDSAEGMRTDGFIRLDCTTRIVVASRA